MVNMMNTSDINITTDDILLSVVPILGQWNIFELI